MIAIVPGRRLIKTVIRDLSAHKLQLILMVLGVALGSAVVVAIDLANTSAATAFDLSTQALVGRATHQIQGGPGGVEVRLYRDLVLEFDEIEFAPVVEALGAARELGDRPLRVLGVDFLSEGPFRDLLAGSRSPQALESFYVNPGQAIISNELAQSANLAAGDQIQLQVNQDLETIRIAGVLHNAGGSASLPSDVLLMDVAVAQDLLNMPETLSRIDVIAPDQQVPDLEMFLPPGLSLLPASQQAQTASDLTAAFRLNLTALSLLALIVGVFLIYNTLMFSVVRRRQVFAILRSLGVTREQVLLMIAIEAAVIGLAGGLLGIGLGWVLGQGAVRLVSQTINDLYFVVSVRDAPLTAIIIAKSMSLALGASLLAAAGPSWEAASASPASALQRSSLERKVQRWLLPVSISGAILALLGTTVLWLSGRSLALSFVGMFMILVGLACLVPAATSGLMWLASAVFRLSDGTLGRIAARTVTRALSRTSVAIAALMVALSVTIGVGVMIDSFRATVENWLDLTLRADVYVSRPVTQGGRPTASLEPELADRLARLPGVSHVETFRSVSVESEYGPIELSVVDSSAPRDPDLYRFARGSAEQIWSKVQSGSVIISEPLAARTGVTPGDQLLRIRTDEGWQDFPVEAIYYDYSSDRGAALMSDQVYQRYFDSRLISSVALFAREGASLDELASAARAELSGSGLQVQQNRAVRDQALRVFDRTFAITSALRLLAVIVAFVGVLSALLALQIERQRELATLRALGITPAGLVRLTFFETGLMGLAAGLLAIPTGLTLAAVLAYVINVRSFGWRIDLALSPDILLQALAVGVAAALLAGVYPVRKLSRLPIAQALRRE